MQTEELRAYVRDVPDFPQPGILFRDLTPLLKAPEALECAVAAMTERARSFRPNLIAGIDSRGFLFGAPIALRLGIGFVPIRKPGKLPWAKLSESYRLEYGSGTLEMHQDAVAAGDRIVVVDDLLATGGTAAAAIRLLQRCGAEPVACSFAVELVALHGRSQLGSVPVDALLTY